MALMNKLRIWINGQVGEIQILTTSRSGSTTPGSGLTYVARLLCGDEIDGKVVDKGIGSRMLQRANALIIATYEWSSTRNRSAVLDSLRNPQLVLDRKWSAIVVGQPDARNALRYVGLIDATAADWTMLGFGPGRRAVRLVHGAESRMACVANPFRHRSAMCGCAGTACTRDGRKGRRAPSCRSAAIPPCARPSAPG